MFISGVGRCGKCLIRPPISGIVSFITASSYLRGPGFAGMRRKMREVFDELWIIDLEGDSIGARKTENVFSIRTSVAIGLRDGEPKPETPAQVWKVRLTGTGDEKLAKLERGDSFDRFDWHRCSNDWDAPFYPEGNGDYFELPRLTDVFPWQQSGVKAGRTWPISINVDNLNERWGKLLSSEQSQRSRLFVNRRTGRKVTDTPPTLKDAESSKSSIHDAKDSASNPQIVRYAFRSFDLEHVIADARLLDRASPPLWSARGENQIFMTSVLTDVLGFGPAATVSAEIPDLHHFWGRGGKDVIPLWRNADGSDPNVTKGLLQKMSDVYGVVVSADRLFAYAYGILASPTYVDRFWDELELPPPRLPITKGVHVFNRVADHGAELLHLHTYCKRFSGASSYGSVPQGDARCTRGVSLERYPESHEYDRADRTLGVGDGVFAPIKPEVWDYSVSGKQIVKTWLDRRSLKGSGRKSSPLDDIRPKTWDFTEELLELLWVLERTIELQPHGTALLDEVCQSELFSATELPTPTAAERRAPRRPVSNVGPRGTWRVEWWLRNACWKISESISE